MRATKVYSITMPAAMGARAERLAKKENRTMSELVREALRKYEEPKMPFDEFLKQLNNALPVPPEIRAIRAEAKRKGLHKMSMKEIDREVAAVRSEAQKRRKRTA